MDGNLYNREDVKDDYVNSHIDLCPEEEECLKKCDCCNSVQDNETCFMEENSTDGMYSPVEETNDLYSPINLTDNAYSNRDHEHEYSHNNDKTRSNNFSLDKDLIKSPLKYPSPTSTSNNHKQEEDTYALRTKSDYDIKECSRPPAQYQYKSKDLPQKNSYKQGDFVYLEPTDCNEPYRIGKIIEINNSRINTRSVVRVCLFWRATDVPFWLLGLDEHSEIPLRLVVGTMQRITTRISCLQGKCKVVHETELPDINEYIKWPDCFYFSKVYSYWTRRIFEAIPVKQCYNLPYELKLFLASFDYLVTEYPNPKFCANCLTLITHSSYSPLITCSSCKLTYHFKCLIPPNPGKYLRHFTVKSCSKCKSPHSPPTTALPQKTTYWPFRYYGEQSDYFILTKFFHNFASETYLPSNRIGSHYSAIIFNNSSHQSPTSDTIPSSRLPLSPTWSDNEVKIFEKSLEKNSDNLYTISKLLPKKSSKNVVAFYYKWIAKKRPSVLNSYSKYRPKKSSFSSYCESHLPSYCESHLSGSHPLTHSPSHVIINVPRQHILKYRVECSNCASRHDTCYKIISPAPNKIILCSLCCTYFLKYAILPKVRKPIVQRNSLNSHNNANANEKRKNAFSSNQKLRKLRTFNKQSPSLRSSDEEKFTDEEEPEVPKKIPIYQCAICFTQSSPLITCTVCSLTIHPACYGISQKPSAQPPFLCDRCLNEKLKTYPRTYDCVFCPKSSIKTPQSFNAIKKTRWNNWAHVFCALWSSSALFADNLSLSPIYVCPPLLPKTCVFCNDPTGICARCHHQYCSIFFHVSCARSNHLAFSIFKSHHESSRLILGIFCNSHKSADMRNALNLPLNHHEIQTFITSKKLIPPSLNSLAKQLFFSYTWQYPYPQDKFPSSLPTPSQKSTPVLHNNVSSSQPLKVNILNPLPRVVTNGK